MDDLTDTLPPVSEGLPSRLDVEPVGESDSLVVTLRRSGSLRPDLAGSKSHTDLLSFGLQSDEGNRTLQPVSGLDHFLRELRGSQWLLFDTISYLFKT